MVISVVSLDIKTYSVYDIIEATDDIYSSIEHREIDIALQRWGTGRYVHYDEIGKNYNLTRERIRQILAKIKDKFVKRNEKYFNEWFKLFLEELIDKPAPISSDFLKHCDTKYTPFVYLGLFSEIFNDIPFGNFFPKSFEQLVNRKIERVPRWAKIVELIHKLPINHGEMTPQNLTNILASKGYSISDQLLCFKIIFGLRGVFFYKEANKYFLLRSGGIRDITFSILNSSNKPLEFEEIMKIVRKYYYNGSKYDSLSSVIGNLKQDKRILQFNRYEFGVEKHFAYPKETWSSICLIAKNFLAVTQRQCYVMEIFEHVKIEHPLLRSKYELVNILRTDKEIIDLGFFTFSLADTGIKSRTKLKDLILKIFKDDPRIRHYLEIKKEILNIRHVRSEGMNVLLKNIKGVIKYPCSFYGLKDLYFDNITSLSKNHEFIVSYVSSVIYPNTKISKLLEFFINDTNKNNCLITLNESNKLEVINSLVNTEPFIVSKNWSIQKLVKCILFNYHKPMYLTEIKWILNDLGIPDEVFDENKYKFIEDKQMIKKNHTLEYFDYDIDLNRNNDLIDTFYELLLDTRTTFAFKDFVSEFSDDLEHEGLDEKKLRAILEDDERFIITDELIMVKSL